MFAEDEGHVVRVFYFNHAGVFTVPSGASKSKGLERAHPEPIQSCSHLYWLKDRHGIAGVEFRTGAL